MEVNSKYRMEVTYNRITHLWQHQETYLYRCLLALKGNSLKPKTLKVKGDLKTHSRLIIYLLLTKRPQFHQITITISNHNKSLISWLASHQMP